MKLHFPVEELWAQVKKMGASPVKYKLEVSVSQPLPEIITRFNQGGEDIALGDVENVGGLLSSHGAQIVLYIPDHGQNIDSAIANGANGKKVHVADCITLEEMRKKNRFQRYRAVVNTTGDFEIFGFSVTQGMRIESTARLRVCINCLKHLNYKGYVTDPRRQREILAQFNLKDFFAEHSTLFRYLPTSFIEKKEGYSDDWESISKRFRESKNFICESCHVDLSSQKHLLHAHHIDGNKRNNQISNLMALCADCHRKQPLHDYMYVKAKEMSLLQQLRKEQGILKNTTGWDDLIELADSAYEGLLRYYQREGNMKPEIDYQVTGPGGAILAEAKVAWPDAKYAVVNEDADKKILVSLGWKVVTLAEALREFR